jgi:hypothetical protein
MKKAVIFSLLGIFLLFAAGALARIEILPNYQPVNRLAEPPTAPGEMSWNTYNKVRMAMGSFDLVNGLTRQDLESLDSHRSLSFYYLVACLWLAAGMRFRFRRPHRGKPAKAAASDDRPSPNPPRDS